MTNHYTTLGLNSPSNPTEIKKAYRTLAKKYHPDINNTIEAEDKFKEINEAYETLGNEQNKRRYDAHSNNFNHSFGNDDQFNMNSMFSQFGFEQQKKPQQKKTFSQELRTIISLSFEESIFGHQDKAFINTYKVECGDCKGYGGTFSDCSVCGGHGMITSVDGFLNMRVTCKDCNGRGKIISSICGKCNSKGFIPKKEEIKINIPAGITNKSTMVSRGNGNKINNKRGDLFIAVDILPSPIYRRENNNIIMSATVSVVDIMKKKTLIIKGLQNEYEIDLNNAFQGKNFIFPSEGVKSMNSDKIGDFIIEIGLSFPELTEKQKDLLENF